MMTRQLRRVPCATRSATEDRSPTHKILAAGRSLIALAAPLIVQLAELASCKSAVHVPRSVTRITRALAISLSPQTPRVTSIIAHIASLSPLTLLRWLCRDASSFTFVISLSLCIGKLVADCERQGICMARIAAIKSNLSDDPQTQRLSCLILLTRCSICFCELLAV
jgi:hypothetical protein